MTTRLPAPVCGMPHFGCAARAASCAASQSGDTVRFRNPGPAISTFSKQAVSMQSTTFCAAWRGFVPNAFAHLSASLHW